MSAQPSGRKSLEQLAALGIDLGSPPDPSATYTPITTHGSLLFISGQKAQRNGELIARGLVGDQVDFDTGVACARQCAINILGHLLRELGSLDAIDQILKLTAFVASAEGFDRQHLVANGASELMVEVLGADGLAARSAVGVRGMPSGTPVAVEAIVARR